MSEFSKLLASAYEKLNEEFVENFKDKETISNLDFLTFVDTRTEQFVKSINHEKLKASLALDAMLLILAAYSPIDTAMQVGGKDPEDVAQTFEIRLANLNLAFSSMMKDILKYREDEGEGTTEDTSSIVSPLSKEK